MIEHNDFKLKLIEKMDGDLDLTSEDLMFIFNVGTDEEAQKICDIIIQIKQVLKDTKVPKLPDGRTIR